MIWWASQPSRARSERRAIADLQERSDWLRDVTWRLTPQARLCTDFDLVRLGEAVPLTLTYPGFFPDMPPQITPRDGARLTGHQWGAGGELCLEYRPDNWDPSVTGAMMMESAYRLLTGERPAPGEYASVASAHRMTVGQNTRGSSNRLLVPADLAAMIAQLALHQPVEFEAAEHLATGHWLAFPRRLGSAELPIWTGAEIFPDLTKRKGFAVRLVAALGGRVLPTFEFFDAVVRSTEREDLIARLDSATEEFTMLVECDGAIFMMSLAPGTGKRYVFDYASVALPEDAPRLPAEYGRLARASVAIVGCGSVGSKVGASLARAGVGRFVLVDGDLVFPGNVVRNDLDWRAVGLNKPDAVSQRIKSILPSAMVSRRRLLLGGQESSASTESALEEIGGCDIIVDATADPQVYNLCAAIARDERRPIVWGEVFAGGIGALVGRLRPDVEPVPHQARRQILDWCASRGVEVPQGRANQYGLDLGEDLPPLIADDAEVSLLADHMSRFVLDTLSRSETIFPHPAYAIGFRKGWIFEAPFDTWPISLSLEEAWGPQQDEGLEDELRAFTAEFFPASPEGPAE